MPGTKKVIFNLTLGSPTDWPPPIESWHSTLLGNDILLLTGEMGAGKTSFVNEMLSRWGNHSGASPTFAFQHSYQVKDFEVSHWDLFRIKSDEDLESLGFWDQLSEQKVLIVEWPEILGSAWFPPDRRVFALNFSNNAGVRTLEMVRHLLP